MEAPIKLPLFQVFRTDLKINWLDYDILHAAREHIGQLFAQTYGVAFPCSSTCCNVACQSDNLIREFIKERKIFTRVLGEFENVIKNKKVELQLTQDSVGKKVVTRIDSFRKEEHPALEKELEQLSR